MQHGKIGIRENIKGKYASGKMSSVIIPTNENSNGKKNKFPDVAC